MTARPTLVLRLYLSTRHQLKYLARSYWKVGSLMVRFDDLQQFDEIPQTPNVVRVKAAVRGNDVSKVDHHHVSPRSRLDGAVQRTDGRFGRTSANLLSRFTMQL